MNSTVLVNIIRFIILVLIQVMLLRSIDFGEYGYYLKIFIYPLALLMLPLKMQTWATLLIAFFTGLTVDMFYDSAGMHAGACVAMMFARPLIINLLEPRGGYENNPLPNKDKLGTSWFIQYIACCFVIFMVIFFIYETFLFENLGKAIIKALLSYAASLPIIFILIFIFNPKR